ncbi:MAG: methyltransferase domain-containing protein [Verrucomicrobia bacterium]|nr:methyltransferase domain-containing protein [Verrucomicrobiota bacterium]
MSRLKSKTPPTPARFFDTINAYQRTAALKGAIQLDLFTALGKTRATARVLAGRCDASERGVAILCDYLAIQGFLAKRGDRYELTADAAAFLDRRSPHYLGGTIEFLLAPTLREAFDDLAAAARKGGTVISHSGTLSSDHPVWVKFARAMAPLMRLPAQALARMIALPPKRAVKVLDVAAGHGVWGIAFAQQHRNVQVVAVDWPSVLRVARENARAAGVESRYTTVAGSAFDVDHGAEFDLVLLPNFLHHFDPDTCVRLLEKLRAALVPDGRVVTVEFVPHPDRVSPPGVAAFSLTMLATTPHGNAYTFKEYQRMFRQAGFAHNQLRPLPAALQQVIVSKR